MNKLGIQVSVYTTRLRQSLVNAIPDIQEVKNNSRCWDLLFNESLTEAVFELKRHETASERVASLSRAAIVLREAIFESRNNSTSPLKGSIVDVPEEMRIFLSLVLNGSQVGKDGEEVKATVQVIGTIGQMISYNIRLIKSCRHVDVKGNANPHALVLEISIHVHINVDAMECVLTLRQ